MGKSISKRHSKGYKYWASGLLLLGLLLSVSGCGSAKTGSGAAWGDLTSTGRMELEYATQFSVEYFEGGCALITIAGEDQFLLAPEDGVVPRDLDKSITVVQKPLRSTYLAASSAMDFYRQLDCLDYVRMTSTKSSDWSFEDVRQALDNEEMLYVGKYSAPDYETIVDEDCQIAIESTMIYHSPEIREKLLQMGIPVMVERSSYEADPLGRMEWIKLYGLLCEKEEEAESFFKEQTAGLNELLAGEQTGKKVAFFYVSSAGYVNVRKPGDYISKMIELAGGTYALSGMEVGEDNALSTLNMQMEDFYASAHDADILIYNSTIEGNLESLDQLYAKNKLFKEFKAVKEGNVWCTENDMFQQTTGVVRMITELYSVIHDDYSVLRDETGGETDLEFLHLVK